MASPVHELDNIQGHTEPPGLNDTGASESAPLGEDPYSRVRFGSISLFQPWFPEINPSDPRSQGVLRKLSDRRVSLVVHQAASISVLAFNTAVTAYVIHKYGISSNIGDIFGSTEDASCGDIKQYNRLLHFAINVLSTILMGSSNYCAQLLVAPTRRDIHKAHLKKEWFDVGVQSIHNLRRIDRKRRILWFCLMLSSGVLHLIWNSAVFIAIPVSQYNVALVTSDFLEVKDLWNESPPGLNELRKMATNGTAVRLTPEACIIEYAGPPDGLKDVLLVSSNITTSDGLSLASNTNSSVLTNFTTGAGVDWAIGGAWMCSARAAPGEISKTFCTEQSLLPNASTWTYHGLHFRGSNDVGKGFWSNIDHCFTAGPSQNMKDKCALRVSAALLAMVCIFNALKCTCICLTAHVHFKGQIGEITTDTGSPEPYLITVGDAVASFLERRDRTTSDLRVTEKRDFSHNRWPNSQCSRQPKERRWLWAATPRRWSITASLCIAMLVIVGILLGITIRAQKEHGIGTDIPSLWGYGLGGTQLWATALTGIQRKMKFNTGFFFATFFANMFQIIVSALYFLYNNLLTVMLVAAEWNDYISEWKTLRVSCPRGIQRSSYFLSLPYKYSVTLLICSGLLHWLISQSIFVIQTVGYKAPNFEHHSELDASVIGYSSIGIILSMTLGSIMVVALGAIGFFAKYKPKKLRDTPGQQDPTYPMPLVSTCTAAISAACHRHDEDKDAHLLPVRWGCVTDAANGNPGRFCFTTARVVRYPLRVDGDNS